jgi:hypothetical protein
MTLYGAAATKLAGVLGVLGGLALLACLIWTAYEGASPDSFADCHDKLSTLAAGSATAADEAGVLRIMDVWPQTIQLSGRLCLAVAGVAAKATDAQAAANANRAPVDIALVLDDRRAPLTVKATAVPGPQVLTYEFSPSADATSDTGKFWRGLLAGKIRNGAMQLSVGVSKSASTTPEAIAAKPITIRVYRLPIVALGGLAMALLIVAFTIFAANSTILRDTPLTTGSSAKGAARIAAAKATADAAKAASDAAPNDANLKLASDNAAQALKELMAAADQPIGTFSLGRTQMALWLGLTTAGFIFLWLNLGIYLNVITASVLVLLGINGATGLAAIVIDQPAAGGAPLPEAESESFLSDLACDGDGPKLQRIQVMIWTCILAVIFFWNTIWNFVFVDFDTNLLLLMGIANAMYLGFKPGEKA